MKKRFFLLLAAVIGTLTAHGQTSPLAVPKMQVKPLKPRTFYERNAKPIWQDSTGTEHDLSGGNVVPGYGIGIDGSGKVILVSDVKHAKSAGVVGDGTTDDTPALQNLANGLGFGQAMQVTGRPRVNGKITIPHGRKLEGTGHLIDYAGLRLDTTYHGTVVQSRNGSSIKDLALFGGDLTRDADTTQIGFQIVENDNAVTWEDVSGYGYNVGQYISSYYHFLRGIRLSDHNIGQWYRGRPNPAFSYTGAIYSVGAHIKNSSIAGVFFDGFVSTTTLSGYTLEKNRAHIWNRGGRVKITDLYAGDGSRYGLLNDGGRIVIENDGMRPLQGGGGYLLPGETARGAGANYDGAGVRNKAGGEVVLRNVDLPNTVWYNTGYQAMIDENGTVLNASADFNRGAAIHGDAGTSVELSDHVTTNVIFPVRGFNWQLRGRTLKNYIRNGSFNDVRRLPHTLNHPAAGLVDTTKATPLGGYEVTITQPSGVYYEVPEEYVGKNLYFVVAHTTVTGGSFLMPLPGYSDTFGRSPAGWQVIPKGDPAWPWKGVAGITGDNQFIATLGGPWADSPIFDYVPVRILSRKGCFHLFSPGSVKLWGVWLIEAKDFPEFPLFHDANPHHLASAVPTLGTWNKGDYVAPLALGNINEHGWTATGAGMPGTWNDFIEDDKLSYMTVATYSAAVIAATGTKPKRIRVLVDTDGYASTYEYWPDSTAPDKLERLITY